MESFSEKMNEFIKVLKTWKEKSYSVEHTDLKALDDYQKSLYLKVLCTTILYENEASEMQLLYLKRIISGTGIEERAEEYLRKALEITDTELKEFLTLMKGDRSKYYFALDSIILSALGNKGQNNLSYLAELLESIGIEKRDMEYLCRVAKSVVAQSSLFYDDAKAYINENVSSLDIFPYVKNFYSGAVIDTPEKVIYSALNRESSSTILYPTKYERKSVGFQNLDIALIDSWIFNGCDQVHFKGCVITGGKNSLVFRGCREVYFEQCTFQEFRSRTIIESPVVETIIENCFFLNCVFNNPADSNVPFEGGVIYTDRESTNGINTICNTVFQNCGSRNMRHDCYVKGCISNCQCEVSDSKFYNCWSYNNYNNTNDSRGMFNYLKKSNNNQVNGSAPLKY